MHVPARWGSEHGVENSTAFALSLDACRRDVADMTAKIDAATSICGASISDLRRQHHALTKRRGRGRAADASNYALGAGLVLVGMEGVDDTALVGLMAHPDQMLGWLAQVRRTGAGPMFGDLVKAVFTDQACYAWCLQWGRVLQWRRRKALYDAAVTSFMSSGKAGPKARWRREEITDDQAALITTLAHILGEPLPGLANRGEAFEWIYARGGNPTYWQEPASPPVLGSAHD